MLVAKAVTVVLLLIPVALGLTSIALKKLVRYLTLFLSS